MGYKLVDDLDGSMEDVQTVRLMIDGNVFDIDLGPANRAALADFYAPYLAAGRKSEWYQERQAELALAAQLAYGEGQRDATPKKRATKKASAPKAEPVEGRDYENYDRDTFKAWAKAESIKLGRGRVSRDILDRWYDSQKPA